MEKCTDFQNFPTLGQIRFPILRHVEEFLYFGGKSTTSRSKENADFEKF